MPFILEITIKDTFVFFVLQTPSTRLSSRFAQTFRPDLGLLSKHPPLCELTNC